AEIGGQDTWQRAELGLCGAGSDRRRVRAQLEAAVAFIEELHLAELVASDIEVVDLPHASAGSQRDDESDEFEA
ncbi:MAG TPA: DUF503 family protein, partial [Myxococcota bacterium]|nr:DUF503 family protein [Myxococcota bacterium]